MDQAQHSFPDDPRDTPFWEERYRQGVTPWDLGGPAPPFQQFMEEAGAPPPGKMIVLGSGRGHDAIYFARLGFEVTAVDFAASAVADARQAAQAAGVNIEFVQADLFALDSALDHTFDYVLEHTCFAAIPVIRRTEYVQVVRRLLKPGGLYIAILPAHGRQGGPPFTTNREEVRALFEPSFTIESLEVPTRQVEARKGKELFALMRPVGQVGAA